MSTIHQIYCTHCTHGTSALERREGELAHRMLGYSARSGSLAAHDLRRYYRQVERYVYYYLPRDTPGEEKLRLTASSAPRRLIYLPSTSGLQVVGQVCYRQTDTEGRPGSYFAHVLFREEKDGPGRWSHLDCLKLWGAPGWVEEDSPDIPFLLRPFGSLAEMLCDRRPAIDDDVFLSFLRTPAGDSFDDPAGVIPPRWRRQDADRRCRLFTEAFRGLLEIGNARRESLLLVIEPSVAALVFFGIVRLLPGGGIREGISFSTFEPNTDRLTTTLAGTAFHDTQKTDLRPDAYRSRGFAINSFLDRRSDNRRPQAPYAETIVRRLLDDGWEAVDWRLGNFQSAGARRAEDLDGLAVVDRLAPALLDPQAPPATDGWRKSRAQTNYLRQVLGRQLRGLHNPDARLEPLVGGPSHLLILELIAGEPEIPGTRDAAAYLLKRLPGEKIADLLNLDGISGEAKVEVLVRYVTAQADLPPGCDRVWGEATWPGGPPARGGDPLLPHVLAQLDLKTLEQFYSNVAGQRSDAFLTALLEACNHKRSKRIPLTQIVAALDDEALLSLFRNQGSAFFENYPEDEPALGKKLHQIVTSLPEPAGQFRQRLDLVLAAEHLLPADRDQELATAWASCRRAILEIGRLQEQKSGVLRLRPVEQIEAASRRMAEAARRAMPPDTFEDDRRGTRKRDVLRQIGQHLLGGKSLLPPRVWQHEALWQKIAWFFEMGQWPSAPLRKMCPKSRSSKSGWIIGGGILGTLLLVVAIGALLASKRPESRPSASRSADAGKQAADPIRPAPQDVATTRPAGPAQGRRTPPAEDPAGEPAPGDRAEEAAARSLAEAQARVRREAEEARRRAADEEARRRARQEAAQAAADLQAGPAEHEARPPSPRPPDPTALKTELAWKAGAEQFARQHAGKFFYQQPLDDGKFEIPPESVSFLNHPPQLFLGDGKLQFGSESHVFGEGFRGRPPAARQEIPLLAAALGLESVWVEIQVQATGTHVTVDGVPYASRRKSLDEMERKTEPLERLVNMIRARLTIYRSRGAAQDKKDNAYNELIGLAGINFPKIPPRPNGLEERFRQNPEAFEKALKTYRDALAANDRLRDQVIPLALQKLSSLDEQIDRVREEYRQRETGVRRDNEQALAELKRGCRQISVLVYQVGRDSGGGPVSPPPDAPTRPSPAPGPPAGVDPPSPGERVSLAGEYKLEQRAAQGLPPPAVAEVRPLLLADGGKPLPAWYKHAILTGCQLLVENRDGFIVRMIEVQDIDTERAVNVFDRAAAIRVRFRFFLRGGGHHPAQGREVGVTPSHLIAPIETGKQYTVKLELSKEGLEELRALSESAKSGES